MENIKHFGFFFLRLCCWFSHRTFKQSIHEVQLWCFCTSMQNLWRKKIRTHQKNIPFLLSLMLSCCDSVTLWVRKLVFIPSGVTSVWESDLLSGSIQLLSSFWYLLWCCYYAQRQSASLFLHHTVWAANNVPKLQFSLSLLNATAFHPPVASSYRITWKKCADDWRKTLAFLFLMSIQPDFFGVARAYKFIDCIDLEKKVLRVNMLYLYHKWLAENQEGLDWLFVFSRACAPVTNNWSPSLPASITDHHCSHQLVTTNHWSPLFSTNHCCHRPVTDHHYSQQPVTNHHCPNDQSLISIVPVTTCWSPLPKWPITDHHYPCNQSLITTALMTSHWSSLSL